MLPDLELTEYEITLHEGDRLLIFSDGVPDAVDRQSAAYGYDRLLAITEKNKSLTAEALVDAIMENIGAFSGGAEAFDDLTLPAAACGKRS